MKACISCGHSFVSEDWICPQCGKGPLVQAGFRSFLKENPLSQESFDSLYFPRLYQLERGNFWFQYRVRLILKAIEYYFPSINTMLEIGCGTGFVLSEVGRKFPRFSLTGSDLFVEGLSFAKARAPGANFYQIDACLMPFIEEFDLILALDILEHVEADSKALGQMSRSLKPGGGLIVTVPQHQWLWSKQDEKAFHRRRYSRRELVKKMRCNGFHVVRTTSFITLLLPLMVLSRIYAQFAMRQVGHYDPLRELGIHPVINKIMHAVCAAEEVFIKRGVSLPAGGSLLCIAQKGK